MIFALPWAAARAMANFGLTDLAVVKPYAPVWRETISAVGAERLVLAAKAGVDLATLRRGAPRERQGLLVHRKIQIRPEHIGLAPEAHGAIGIELLGVTEGAQRFETARLFGMVGAGVEALRAFAAVLDT